MVGFDVDFAQGDESGILEEELGFVGAEEVGKGFTDGGAAVVAGIDQGDGVGEGVLFASNGGDVGFVAAFVIAEVGAGGDGVAVFVEEGGDGLTEALGEGEGIDGTLTKNAAEAAESDRTKIPFFKILEHRVEGAEGGEAGDVGVDRAGAGALAGQTAEGVDGFWIAEHLGLKNFHRFLIGGNVELDGHIGAA